MKDEEFIKKKENLRNDYVRREKKEKEEIFMNRLERLGRR